MILLLNEKVSFNLCYFIVMSTSFNDIRTYSGLCCEVFISQQKVINKIVGIHKVQYEIFTPN
jgi:nicotinamide riboside transporter PnuC